MRETLSLDIISFSWARTPHPTTPPAPPTRILSSRTSPSLQAINSTSSERTRRNGELCRFFFLGGCLTGVCTSSFTATTLFWFSSSLESLLEELSDELFLARFCPAFSAGLAA